MPLSRYKHIPIIATLLPLAAFAGPLAYAILVYGVDIPYWDQWEYVRFFRAIHNGALQDAGIFKLHNEYRQLIPNLVFMIAGYITAWRVQWEMIMTLLMACWTGSSISGMVRQTMHLPTWLHWLLPVFICATLLTPAQYENWLLGVQFVYFFPVFCLVLCLKLHDSHLSTHQKWWAIVVISFLSTLSSVNGFLCWLALFPFLLYNDITPAKKMLLTSLGTTLAASSLFVYFYQYAQPGNLPTLLQQGQSVIYIIQFLLRVLGNGFGQATTCSLPGTGINEIAGTIVFTVWCAGIFWLLRDWRKLKNPLPMVQWTILGVYGLGTGVMVAFARSNLGLMQACAPRYIGFTIFFGIAALLLPVLLYYNTERNTRTRIFVSVAVGLIVLSTGIRLNEYRGDFAQLEWFGAKVARAKAGLLLSETIPFTAQQELIYPSAFRALHKKARWLNSNGYIRPGILQSPYLDTANIEAATAVGIFSQVMVQNDSIVANGIIDNTLLPLLRHAVVVTIRPANGRRTITGMDNSGKHNWTVRTPRSAIGPQPAEVEAWLLNADNGLFTPLNGIHPLED